MKPKKSFISFKKSNGVLPNTILSRNVMAIVAKDPLDHAQGRSVPSTPYTIALTITDGSRFVRAVPPPANASAATLAAYWALRQKMAYRTVFRYFPSQELEQQPHATHCIHQHGLTFGNLKLEPLLRAPGCWWWPRWTPSSANARSTRSPASQPQGPPLLSGNVR
jgi:hypothetical protein